MRNQETYLVALAALFHHLEQEYGSISEFMPASLQERINQIPGEIVSLAERLAAGSTSGLLSADEQSRPPFLVSIFSLIGVNEDGRLLKVPENHYVPFSRLSIRNEKSIFGMNSAATSALDGRQEKQSLLESLGNQLRSLKTVYEKKDDTEGYLESLMQLLQQYAWCIPAAHHPGLSGVSLYDHSRMTAALAAAFADQNDFPKDKLKKLAEAPEHVADEVALLVGGDISGVQDFIYTISSKGAARMLRGRSFYLQLLTEAVVRFVLRRLGLPYTNVIYSGGGHFYLLAPLSTQNELPKIQAEVCKILLQQHGAQLYLAMGWAAVPAGSFQSKQLSEYWQKMQNELTIAKNRRYWELGNELYQFVFALPEHGGNPDETCSVCGDDWRKIKEWDELETQDKICTLCRSFAETIGKELTSSRFLALKFGTPRTVEKETATAYDILAAFGMQVQFLPDAKTKVEVQAGQHLVIWALDDPPEEQWPAVDQLAPRWLRYTVNRVPVVKDKEEVEKINKRLGKADEKEKARIGQPMTFTHLSILSESDFRRLGVLRMDVDNLGTVFKDGLGDLFSLSRMAALSSQISLFFEGWLKRIVEMEDPNNRVYAVYSGGDDLFLIAPWEKVPPLALKIADDFARYTGGHPGLHISGGMAFIGGKYPIYQAAEDAAEAEELAKKDGKNAFAFLGKRWVWTDFRELAERKNALKDLVMAGKTESERGGSKSILQVLRSLAKMEEEAAEAKGRPVWGRWMWLGAYQLKRMEEHYARNDALKQKLAEVRRKVGDFQNVITWGAAARWTQLETRKKRDE